MQIEELFKFPILMVDSRNEERKGVLDLPNDQGIDLIESEAEEPYYDFTGSIRDYWIPGSEESFEKAKDGYFEACFVRFRSGDYIIPWNKEKFKRLWKEFADNAEKELPQKVNTRIIMVPDDKIDEFLKQSGLSDEWSINEEDKNEGE